MKLKNTLFLLLLAGGLYGFIRFYEGKLPGTRESQEQAGRVVTFNRDTVETIYIKNTETKIELHKDKDGLWRLEQPVKDRADSLAVSQLFTTAEALRYDGIVGEEGKGVDKEQLKEYGLNNSETRVKFVGKDKPVELSIGKDAAVEGKVYIKLESSNRAYVVGKDLKEQLTKKADEFRERKLTDVTVAQVTKATLKTKAGEIQLEKKDQHWTLLKPLKARGNDSKIGDLISQTVAAHIDSFAAEGGNLSTYGLQEPRASITLTVEGAEKPVTVQLGSHPKDSPDKFYARVSTRDAVVLLPKSIDTLFNSTPNDLRDKALLRVEADIVDRINLEGGDGAEKIVLARSGESWVRKAGGQDLPINVNAARRLLDELKVLTVSEFVSDVATDLPKYGLDHPKVKLTLSSYASDNTAETKAGEKPIVSVAFGAEATGRVYAKLDDEPFIVSVPQSFVDLLMTDPLQWQPLDIFHYKAEDISALDITRLDGPAVSLIRSNDKAWKLAKGDDTVNQINVQSLVNTLATLRAVRWMGADKPDYRLDHPAFTVTFQLDGKPGGKLAVAKTPNEDLSYGAVEGREGVFTLARPDLGAFLLPLLEHSAPPPSPAAPLPPAAPPAPAPGPEAPAPAPLPPP